MSTDPHRPSTLEAALRGGASDVRGAVATMPVPPGPGRAPRTRPLLAVVSVAATVAVVAGGLTWLLGGDRQQSAPRPGATTSAPATSDPTPPVTVSPSPTTLCTGDLPVPVYPPAGWTGPADGPAAGSTTTVAPGVRVWHWSGATGSAQLLWPADPTGTQVGTGDIGAAPSGVDQAMHDADGISITHDETGWQLYAPVPGQAGVCGLVQVEFFGDPPAGFGSTIPGYGDDAAGALAALVTDPATLKLVTGTKTVTTLPQHAMKCTGADLPNHVATIRSVSSFPTPQGALAALLDGANRPEFLDAIGWTKLETASGEVDFGVPFEGTPAGWVQLVFVTDTGSGWVADGWETSGC